MGLMGVNSCWLARNGLLSLLHHVLLRRHVGLLTGSRLYHSRPIPLSSPFNSLLPGAPSPPSNRQSMITKGQRQCESHSLPFWAPSPPSHKLPLSLLPHLRALGKHAGKASLWKKKKDWCDGLVVNPHLTTKPSTRAGQSEPKMFVYVFTRCLHFTLLHLIPK